MTLNAQDLSVENLRKTLASRKIQYFAPYVNPRIRLMGFHKVYCELLTMFANQEIKNLMITMPPQHGKSEFSTRNLPAFILGKRPDCKVAIASYNDTFASSFNKDVQRIIDSPEYYSVFPNTTLSSSDFTQDSSNYSLRNGHEFQIVNNRGSLKSVGRGGPLTGSPVDVGILDDLYKDAKEANSPTIREAAWEWYTKVFLTRLHNNSQQLIVFTRWHEDDIIGRLEREEKVVTINNLSDISNIKPDSWVKLNFEAIKESPSTELDSRELNTSLWEERHSLAKLNKYRNLDPSGFNSLFQGDPTPKEGLLYSEFGTYTQIKDRLIGNICLADIADQGTDNLCAIWYHKGASGLKYVYDVLYSAEGAAITLPAFAEKINKNSQRETWIESNSAGEGYARQLGEKVHQSKRRQIETYHQNLNKETKITTEAPTVNREIIFPADWESRWPLFARDIKKFRAVFKANKHDDAPDVLSEIIVMDNKPKARSVTRIN